MALTSKQMRDYMAKADGDKDLVETLKEKSRARLESLLESNSIFYFRSSGNEIIKSFLPSAHCETFRAFFSDKETRRTGGIDIFLDYQRSLESRDDKEKYFIINSRMAKTISNYNSYAGANSVYATYIEDLDEIFFKPVALIKAYIAKTEKPRRQLWMRVNAKTIDNDKFIDKNDNGGYLHHSLGYPMAHREPYHITEEEFFSSLKTKQDFDPSWKLKNKVFFNLLNR